MPMYHVKQLKGFAKGIGYLQMTRCIGKALLKNLGFTDCLNKKYLQKNEVFAHYNKIIGIWIIEGIKNKDLTI